MHTPEFLLQRINESIAGLHVKREPRELFEPIEYSMSIGGKRMRPLLCLLACDAVGGDIEDALAAATGIEIFHNFTLVHDDIMDNAPLRRGQVTVFKKWNTNIAILSGDTMFAPAYEMMGKSKPEVLPSVLSVFTDTAREVCEGQQYDMNFEREEETSLDDYLRMIRLKTAVLLGCSLKVGALCGGADQLTADGLYTFGEKLGIAFQIRDDLLDTFGEEALFGKKTGGDILANKKTYLYLAALQDGSEEIRRELKAIYQGMAMDEETKISRVISLFKAVHVEKTCDEAAMDFYRQAIEALNRLNLPQERLVMLTELARQLLGRRN